MPRPVKSNARYIAGLDGLRAIAVLAVIAYHLNLSFAPGGLLGVGVFFVLSGYLITDLLIAEWSQSATLNLRSFWFRRARRLLPALFLMLIVVTVWMQLFDPASVTKFRGDLIAGVLYVSNWWFIFHHVSYFASFGMPSPFGHLWSLAVEEQFYLLWPLLLLVGLRVVRKRGKLISFTLTGAFASALAMAILYHPGTDPSRVYYGTDTRAFGLLIGAALAIAWPSRKLSAKMPEASRWVLDVIGGSGLIVVLWMMWKTNEYEAFLYRGGLVLVSFATALVIFAVVHPASRLGQLLSWKPLRWIGVRSYGIYLWHYPVITLTTPTVDTNGTNVSRVILQVAASVILAALSWKYVEEPIRQGTFLKGSAQRRNNRGRHRRSVPKGRFIATSCAVLAFGLCVALEWTPHSTATAAVTTMSSQTVSTDESAPAPSTTLPASPHAEPTAKLPSSAHKTSQLPAETKKVSVVAPPSVHDGHGITAIGDSVLVDATPYLQKLLPGIVCDGLVGRQMIQAEGTIATLKANGELGNKVIIELGNNGPFSKNQLISLLNSLGPVKQIVLVNTRVPRPWQDVVNSTLSDVAATYPHTTLVDWYTMSANKNSYFYPDGVHLDPQGAQYYASLLAKSVE